MKKILPLLVLSLIITALILQIVPLAYAEHVPDVYWSKTETDTLAVSGIVWPKWINFTVKNTEIAGDADDIVKFKFVIPKSAEGYALFCYNQSEHELEGWSATPDEFDPAGWPTVLIFEGPGILGIPEGETGWFAVEFICGPSECNYKFAVYTIDSGEPPVTKLSWLYLVIDQVPPVVVIVYPSEGQTIKGEVCINATVTDPADHRSGVDPDSVVLFLNDTGPYDMSYDEDNDVYYWCNETLWEHKALYVARVEAKDYAGNEGASEVSFYWHAIRPELTISPTSGTVNTLTTYDEETGLWTGSIYTYGDKTLGTEVTVEGVNFSPNSEVNVTVVHPYWGEMLVVKNAETDDDGDFTDSFLFPTAPQGIYEVTAVDAERLTPLDPAWFTVVPEIIYKPAIVIGPAVIEVIATGFPRWGHVYCFMFDGTDALLGINIHIWAMQCWHTDENGTLRSRCCPFYESECGVEEYIVKPGFIMPVLEPGTYEIAIGIEGEYWDGKSIMPMVAVIVDFYGWVHKCTLANNTIAVVNDFKDLMDAIDDLELKLDDIKPVITRIDKNVLTLSTTLGTIEVSLKDISLQLVSIEGDLEEGVATVSVAITDAEDNILAELGTIEGTVTDIEGDVATVKTDVGTLEARIPEDLADKLDELGPTPTTLSITAVLAAIAAIASIVAAVVVLRRLKVAG